MFLERMAQLHDVIKNCITTCNGIALSHDEALQESVGHLLDTKKRGGIVYVIGNGGSAGIASHFSTDLLKALKIPSQTFYDTNVMTCLSNDLGYENVFSFPLSLVMKPEDTLVAISSSGASKNILKAVDEAKEKNCKVITLSGFKSTNPLRTMGDLNFWLDIEDYGLVETGHAFLLHTLIDTIMQNKMHATLSNSYEKPTFAR